LPADRLRPDSEFTVKSFTKVIRFLELPFNDFQDIKCLSAVLPWDEMIERKGGMPILNNCDVEN
jgi:hypothetical protein